MRTRDIFFLIILVIFVVNLGFIVTSRKDPPPPRRVAPKHDHGAHGERHQDDSSTEHNEQGEEESAPYVSIIIPLYNQLQYLDFALQSIFSQAFGDYEIIIVNDGSTEWATRTTLENIKSSNPGKRIQIIHKKRGGLSDARNAGIKQAQAQWILPLDADDMLDTKFLQSAVDVTKEYPGINLVISNLVGFDANDPSRVVSQWSVPPWDPKELANKNMLHCCPLYKKDLWEEAKGYSTAMIFGWEDWEFWLRANKKMPIKPYTLTGAKFLYRVKPGMHSFCTDYNSLCTSVLKTIQPSFYSFDDVLHAHQIIAANKKLALEPIQNQLSVFPHTPALHLWRGLILEKEGSTKDSALDFDQAKRFASSEDWQPALRLALAKRNSKDEKEAREAKQILDNLFERFPNLRGALASVLGVKFNS